MKKPKTTLRPYDATTLRAVCRLQRDNKSFGDFYIMTDGITVWLGEQKFKEPSRQTVAIPRAKFKRLVDWYLAPQRMRAK
jgi:hypothetical protein